MATASRSTQLASLPEKLPQLEAQARVLKARLVELELNRASLLSQRERASARDRANIDLQLADVQLKFESTMNDVGVVDVKIRELTAKPVGTDGPRPQVGVTTLPTRPQIVVGDGVAVGSFLLLLPLVIAFARRIWTRGGTVSSTDSESRARLQRIEQAVESIALEVERIGEAQRFTSKLLADRHSEVVGGGGPANTPRRQPGTITPH